MNDLVCEFVNDGGLKLANWSNSNISKQHSKIVKTRPVNIRSWVSSLVSSLVSSWVLDFFKSWVKSWVKIQDLVPDLILNFGLGSSQDRALNIKIEERSIS